MDNLLLEIGAEEIPAGYIQPALTFLSSSLVKKLTDARIDHGLLERVDLLGLEADLGGYHVEVPQTGVRFALQ